MRVFYFQTADLITSKVSPGHEQQYVSSETYAVLKEKRAGAKIRVSCDSTLFATGKLLGWG
jgi:hypothetical protein